MEVKFNFDKFSRLLYFKVKGSLKYKECRMDKQRIVDLSYSIRGDMMVYPGMSRPVIEWLKRVNQEGSNVSRITLEAHTGTHIDAPKHFIDEGKPIDELNLNRLIGKAVLFRVKDEPRGQRISLQEVKSAGVEIREGDIFLLDTGIYRFFERPEFNRFFPVPTEELLKWLIAKGIKAYGTDACSVDPVEETKRSNHHLILGEGIPIIENLCNLEKLPEKRPFTFFAIPLKIEKAEASPCRAFAILE